MGKLSAHEVGERWRDFQIHHGYRRPYCSFSEALQSSLRWTNETVNIWSHVIPSLVWIYLMTQEEWRGEVDRPYQVFYISLISVGLISATAHTFNIVSEVYNDLCYLSDYLIIASHSFHAALALHTYGLPAWWAQHRVGAAHPWLSVLGGLGAFAIPAISRFAPRGGSRAAQVRATAFTLGVSLMHSPLTFVRVGRCRVLGECLGGEGAHEMALLTQFLAVGFYGTHVPERFFPGGYFDFVGNSHHMLHFFGVASGECQRRALGVDRHRAEHNALSPAVLHLYYALVGTLFVLLAGFRLWLEYHPQEKDVVFTKRNVKEEAKVDAIVSSFDNLSSSSLRSRVPSLPSNVSQAPC